MRQSNHLQERLLVCGLEWKRKHHKLLQHSQSVQLQRSQVRPDTHAPAAAAAVYVCVYAASLKVALLTLGWHVGLFHPMNGGFELVYLF